MRKAAPQSFWRKLPRRIGVASCALIAIVVVLFVGALLALKLGPTRAFVAKQTNSALENLFKGKLVLDRIGGISLAGVEGVDASLYDPKGQRVLRVHGLSVRLDIPALAWQAVVRRPELLAVKVERIGSDHVDVRLIDDGTGTPTIASAFEAQKSSPPAAEEGGGTDIALESIELGHIWVHGGLKALPVIDTELHGTSASLHLDSQRTRFVLHEMRLQARSLPTLNDARGELKASVTLPSASKSSAAKNITPPTPTAAISAPAGMDAMLRFRGTVAGAELNAEASQTRDEVSALVEAPAIGPETLTRLLPSLRTQGSTSVRARVEGTLPNLKFDAALLGAAGRVSLSGTAALNATKSVHAELRASEVNLAAAMPDLSKSDLALNAQLDARLAATGEVTGSYRLEALPSQFDVYATPRALVEGTLAQSSGGVLQTAGTANIEEPGAPTRIAYDVQLRAERGSMIEARVSTRFEGPSRISGLSPGLSLGGSLEVEARVEPDADRFEATANASLRQVKQGANRVERLTLKAKAAGSLSNPQLDARVQASDVSLAERRFKQLDVTATGTLKQFKVHGNINGTQPDRIELDTVIGLDGGFSLRTASISLSDDEGRVNLSADSLQVAGERIRFEGIRLHGAGEMQASGVWQAGLRRLQVNTRELDVPRLARLFGVELPVRKALASFEVQYSAETRNPKGHLRGRAEQVQFGNVQGGAFGLDLVLDERKISGNIDARLGKAARAALVLDDVSFLEPPFTEAKLEGLKGVVALEGDVDLRDLMPILRMSQLPIESARGTIQFAVRVDRNGTDAEAPSLSAQIETRSLRLVGQRDESKAIRTAEEARRSEPWAITGIDARLGLELDRSARLARVRLSVFDRIGDIAALEAETRFAQGFRDLASVGTTLSTLAVRGTLKIPPRSLATLPDLVRPLGVQGVASLQVDAEGTLQQPKIRAAGKVQGLRTGDGKFPVDVDLDAQYERARGELSLRAVNKNRQLAHVQADWTGELPRLFEARGPDEPSPVRGNIEAKLERFPLGVIPELNNRQIRGPLTLDLQLKGLGQDASLRGSFDGAGMVVGQVGIQQFNGEFRTDGNQLTAKLLVGGNGGNVKAQVRTAMRWGSRLAPQIDPDLEAELIAQRFRIETLAPLIGAQVSELEGRLNANLTAKLTKGVPKLDGTASLERGVVQIPAVGQRFSEIDARVSIHEDRIRLERLNARGVTGRLSVTAEARVQGLDLRSAEAHVRIKENEKLPITVEGVSMGDAWGNLDVTLKRPQPTRTELKVTIPVFHLDIPESGSSSVQSLEPAEGIRIGMHRQDGRFVTLPVQPLEEDTEEEGASAGPPSTSLIVVEFGKSVWVTKGQTVKAQLGGRIQVESGGPTSRITGRIEARGGSLDVSGKTFEVERGVVTFGGGDPSNPTVTATARWDSPMNYSVYAEYSGTAQAGKLTLRSEPPLTQDQIISLMLFGSPDGSLGSGSGGGEATAVSVAGGTVAQGLNQALSNFTQLEVSARIDTSTGSARPELVVQLTPRVAARVTRAVGEPAPGQSPDRTFLTVEFRLSRSWALSTVLGDRGASALDLIWRRRY